VFFLEKGVVTTSRTGIGIYREGQKPELTPTRYDITQDAVNDFIEGARTGKLENAAPWAVESTLTAIMGREAIYAKREMSWNDVART
jgi:hypothetical protein